jgi:hypothetical protein
MGTEQTGHAWRCSAMIVPPQDGAPTRDADSIMAAPCGNRQPKHRDASLADPRVPPMGMR